jgi:hypothetical protein
MKAFKEVLKTANHYGCGYGTCTIKETPNHIIIEFYNAGWSECEEVDYALQKKVIPDINNHPMSVYIFPKYLVDMKLLLPFNVMKISSYKYMLNRD